MPRPLPSQKQTRDAARRRYKIADEAGATLAAAVRATRARDLEPATIDDGYCAHGLPLNICPDRPDLAPAYTFHPAYGDAPVYKPEITE